MGIHSRRALGPAFVDRVHPRLCVALTGQTATGAREGLADLPGVHLWFTDSGGTGAPVVFVHAATGSSRVWEYQRPVFIARGYRVITYDRRGTDAR